MNGQIDGMFLWYFRTDVRGSEWPKKNLPFFSAWSNLVEKEIFINRISTISAAAESDRSRLLRMSQALKKSLIPQFQKATVTLVPPHASRVENKTFQNSRRQTKTLRPDDVFKTPKSIPLKINSKLFESDAHLHTFPPTTTFTYSFNQLHWRHFGGALWSRSVLTALPVSHQSAPPAAKNPGGFSCTH